MGVAVTTLFACVSGGDDWYYYYKLLSKSYVMGNGFIFFIFFFVIAVWNIVTSLFIERTMELARPDAETSLLSKQRQDLKDAKELIAICTAGGKRTITLEEFEERMIDTKFRAYFDNRYID